MKQLLKDVSEFHRACDLPILQRPELPEERLALRNKLIHEEAREYFQAVADRDLPAVADALADLIYVAVGAALEFGIPLEQVWDEVQEANMRKVDPETGKVSRRPDGKVLKPYKWEPPDIETIIAWAAVRELPKEN